MTRVITICLLSAFLVCSLCLFPQARAEAASEARQTLENAIDQVLAELQKPELRDPATRAPVQANLERIILALFDFEELSRRAVGQHWKKFTSDQQQRFVKTFEDLLREHYTGMLEDHIGVVQGYTREMLTFIGESPIGTSGDRVQVETTVLFQNKTVPVNYRMQRGNGGWAIYDIIVEGVGMVQNYRSQFQSVLQRSSPEQLIAQVRARAEETRVTNEKKRQGQP